MISEADGEVEKMDQGDITALSIVCITFLEAVAILKGINGVMLSSVLMILAGLAGYGVKTIKTTREENKNG